MKGPTMLLTIEEMELMLDEIAEEFPEGLFKELNGGIILLPEIKYNPHGENNELYILGEYNINGNLGRYISIYYGSMIQVYGHLPNDQMKIQLTKTLKHEFTHHLESLAGARDLEIKDAQYLANYKEQKKQK
jgi:hypothetical protein